MELTSFAIWKPSPIHVLEGYYATVRYLDVQGDIIVTGSYDGI